VIEDVDLQCFTDLFCTAGLDRGFYFLNCTAKRVIFATTYTHGTETYGGQVRLLLK